MAFIDVDEFLVLRDGTSSVPALLRDYEQYGGLVVNWVMFGSSGVQVGGWVGGAPELSGYSAKTVTCSLFRLFVGAQSHAWCNLFGHALAVGWR
jgi:hypothetical protein